MAALVVAVVALAAVAEVGAGRGAAVADAAEPVTSPTLVEVAHHPVLADSSSARPAPSTRSTAAARSLPPPGTPEAPPGAPAAPSKVGAGQLSGHAPPALRGPPAPPHR